MVEVLGQAFISNGVILALSFLALGCPRWCPDACRAGRPLSVAQVALVHRVEEFTGSMLRPETFSRGKLDKLALIHQTLGRVRDAPLGSAVSPPVLLGGYEPLQGRTLYRKSVASFDPTPFLVSILSRSLC